jgi:SAM-dependent methyltransferase
VTENTDNSIQNYRAWKTWEAGDFGQYDAVQARYFALELTRSGMQALQEFGFGNGQFAGWAKAQGMHYAGSELNADLLALAESKGFRAYSVADDLSQALGAGTQDVMVAFDVLEHLDAEQIMALLHSVALCLKPGGLFIARFPSGDSPFARPIQHGDVTHQSVIGSSKIRQLAIGTGLQISQVRAPVLPLTGIGFARLLRRWPIVLARALISKLINVIYNDNSARVISPNMLVVFGKDAMDGH